MGVFAMDLVARGGGRSGETFWGWETAATEREAVKRARYGLARKLRISARLIDADNIRQISPSQGDQA